MAEDHFHVEILRTASEESDLVCSLFIDEMTVAFDELVLATTDGQHLDHYFIVIMLMSGHWSQDWLAVPAFTVAQKIVCRSSNRTIVGAPLCRNTAWIDLNTGYAIDYAAAGTMILSQFLDILKRLSA